MGALPRGKICLLAFGSKSAIMNCLVAAHVLDCSGKPRFNRKHVMGSCVEADTCVIVLDHNCMPRFKGKLAIAS